MNDFRTLKITVVILVVIIIEGCVNYIDDRPETIALVETKVSSEFIYNYYDSVPGSTWNKPKKEWKADFNLYTDPQVRKLVYYFPPPHEEMYFVGFTWPIIIQQVYSDSARKWLNGDEVSELEAMRMQKRFETDIIAPIVHYKENHNRSKK